MVPIASSAFQAALRCALVKLAVFAVAKRDG